MISFRALVWAEIKTAFKTFFSPLRCWWVWVGIAILTAVCVYIDNTYTR